MLARTSGLATRSTCVGPRPADGIGLEVIPAGLEVLQAAEGVRADPVLGASVMEAPEVLGVPRIEIDEITRHHDEIAAGLEAAEVKWFNRARGFGFVSEGEGSPDIFIHMETLRKTAIADLQPETWVYVRFGDGPKGKMAAEVRLSLDSGPAHTN